MFFWEGKGSPVGEWGAHKPLHPSLNQGGLRLAVGIKESLGMWGKQAWGQQGLGIQVREWGFLMEGAVGWEELGGFKGYFGDCWDMGGVCEEGKSKHDVQVFCGWVAVGHPWNGDKGDQDVGEGAVVSLGLAACEGTWEMHRGNVQVAGGSRRQVRIGKRWGRGQ